MQISSPAFADGARIPQKHTADGPDVSPPLAWTNAPEGTAAFALICDDPDAPVGTWVHWVIYNIPPDAGGLAGSAPAQAELDSGALQGTNDFNRIGYGGPAPPAGKPHRYFFKLYALDAPVRLSSGATKAQLLDAVQGHILAEAECVGTYQR